MKKRILAMALGLALMLMAGMAGFAVDDRGEWDVSYAGGKNLDSNYAMSDLANRAFQMQPGDEIELVANLRNRDSSPSNWYMTNTVLDTLEQASNEASGGAYSYRLTYRGPGDSEDLELYNSARVGGEQTRTRAVSTDNRIGLEQATMGLEDWLYLDTLGSGQSGVLRLYVALDGESQGNTYQDTLARLQLNFAVDPVTERTETRTERGELRRIVQTGDKYSAMPFIIVAGISGLLLLLFGLYGVLEQKKLKKAAQKLACLALAGLLAVTMPAALGQSFRAEDQPAAAQALRQYKVRIFPGVQTDTVKGGSIVVKIEGGETLSGPADEMLELSVECGARIAVSVEGVSEEDNATKYYVRGIRESGEDNSTIAVQNFKVERDMDYVIAYGIKGQRVRYALRFVDNEGNRLMDDQIFWGNVGDKPIVACQFIDGYRPNAMNITGTLVYEEELKDNIFQFVYTPLGTNVTTEFIDGGVTVVDLGGAGGGGGGGGGGGAPAGPGGEVLPEPETPLAPPEEIIDLDEPETPLAGMMEDFATSLSGMALPVKIALAGGAIALGTFIILAIVKKRKRKEDAAES